MQSMFMLRNVMFPNISGLNNLFCKHHVPISIAEIFKNCVFLQTQGRNCEHNYDDCLLNPCPEEFYCIDGINKVSCLPPVTDAVPLATTVKNKIRDSTTRGWMPTLNATPTAEHFTGTHCWGV